MGFFSFDSSHWELSVVCQQIFSISYRFRDKRGQRGQKCDFGGYIKFSFFIRFWWDFFHWTALNESFQNGFSRFFLSLPVFEIQGAQKGKNVIFEAMSKFYFSSNFDGIFFIGFLSLRAFRIVQPIFSISYRFQDTRDPKGHKCDFWGQVKVSFWWDFFHKIPLYENFQNSSANFFDPNCFQDTRGPKGQKIIM